MRRFFEPASAPAWLKPVLSSVRAALGDVWDVPVRPFRAAASAFPPATDHDGGLAYDETVERPTFSDGSSWITLAAYDADVAAIAALSTTGLIAHTGAGTAATRTITGTANQVAVADGDGVAGNPTLSLPSAVTAPGSLTTTTFVQAGSYVIAKGGVANWNAPATFLDYQSGTTRGRVGCFDFSSSSWLLLQVVGSQVDLQVDAVTVATVDSGGINLASGKTLEVNGTQVVTARQTAVADATGAGDVVAQLNALLARCRAHGLIGS